MSHRLHLAVQPVAPPGLELPSHREMRKYQARHDTDLLAADAQVVRGWYTPLVLVRAREELAAERRPFTGRELRAAMEAESSGDVGGECLQGGGR